MDISQQRIKAVLEALQLTPSSFAQTYGLSTTTVYSLVSGTRKPGYDTLVELCQAEPRINADYLLRGNGSPLIDPKDSQSAPASTITSPLDFIYKLKQLQASINNVIDTEILDAGSSGVTKKTRLSVRPNLEELSRVFGDSREPVGADHDNFESILLLRMIEAFDHLQRAYSLAFEQQANQKEYKFYAEWVPNPTAYLLTRVTEAYMSVSAICSPERFLLAHRLYCIDLLYCRGSQFMPSLSVFEKWRALIDLEGKPFMIDRLSYSHRSVDYFLTRANDFLVARHFIDLVEPYMSL